MRKSIIIEKAAPTSLKATLNVGAVCNGKVKTELSWQADAKSGLLGGKMKKIQKVKEKIISLEQVESIGVIGDPGCDGLGTYNMKVYAGALEKSSKDDITLVVGDLVPAGTKSYYKRICNFSESIAQNPVYGLRGNHDTGAYEEYFGRQNYVLMLKNFTVVVLDNAMRRFEEEGLELLEEILERQEVENVIIAFHIPVPNHFIQNCVSTEEFIRLQKAYKKHKDKVKYLLCGHVHSKFEDVVDGIPLICTGGGGAMIEDVSKEIRAADIEHHLVHFYWKGGKILYRFENLWDNCYTKEAKDPILREQILSTVQGELMAHLRYLMHADRARRRGMEEVALMFEALASSEYYHARNFYSTIERPPVFSRASEEFAKTEEYEHNHYYSMMEKYCKEQGHSLAEGSYQSALEAEKVHGKLLQKLGKEKRPQTEALYVCPICGYLMTEETKLDRCPSCGAPGREFQKYKLTDNNKSNKI